MTSTYACQRPLGLPEADVEAVCLHALHAINSEATFKSVWQARENALNLAEDVGSPLVQSVDAFSLPLRTKAATKTVRFCEEVQLHVAAEGHGDSMIVPVQHESLQVWDSKPWQLKKSSSSSRVRNKTSLPDDCVSDSLDAEPPDDPHLLPADFPGDQHPDRDRSRHPGQDRPEWFGDMWDLLQAEGTRAEDEEGLVIFLNSYFIHHENHRFHAEARPLRFGVQFADWEPGIRLVWEDLIDPAAELSIVWVRPDPPFAPFPGTVGTVIVQQGVRPDRVACLTSALLPFSPDFRKIVSAHSTELLLSRQQIIALAGVEAVCQHRLQSGFGECTIHIGVPAVQEAQVQITSGLGLTIRVPAPLQDHEVDHNLFLRVQRQARGYPAHSWQTPPVDGQPETHHPLDAHDEVAPEDTVSMMGRRPVPVARSTSSYPISSPSTTSAEDSTSDSAEHDWKQTVLFTLSGSSHSALLPWDDHASMRLHIAQALQIHGTELLDHHIVAALPDDLASLDLCCVLPQLLQEPRPSVFQCLVLLDVEVYEENDIQPSAFRRHVKWMPNVINWISCFRLLGFEHHCVRREHQCRLWHNNRLVDPSETVPLRLNDGDYMKIFIGDPECGFRDLSHLGISDDAFDQLGIPEDAFDDMSALQMNLLSADDPEHVQQQRTGLFGWRDLPRAMSCDRPFLAQQVEQHRLLTATSTVPELFIPDLDNWQTPLGMHFLTSVHSFASPEEAHTEWLTWYLHTTDHPQCEAPRTLHLDAEREFWHRDVAVLWRDRLRPHVATQIHLVQPEPPRADFQTHSGHLLIVQGTDFQTVPALISTKFQSASGQRLSQMARFLPQFVTNHDLIGLLRLDRVCSVRQCFAEVDGLELDHEGFAQLQPGEGVCFHVKPPEDATSLLQTANTLHSGPLSCNPAATRWKLDQDDLVHNSTLDGREHSAAPHQAWVRLHGTRDPPQLQDDPLWSLWNRPQFQVLDQDHQPTMKFETWYVSSIGYPRCSRSRIVTLNADVDAWIERLRQVWSDRVSPHMHLELAIVHPAVVHEAHGGHLILMQAVTPEEKATLLSSYWNSRHGALQDRFAQLVPPRLSYPDLIQFNFLDTLCHHPEFACRAQVGERTFESHMHWPVYHGLHLEVFIDHVALQSLVQAFTRPTDAVDIPQLPPQEADSFVQPRLRRRRPARDDQDDEADDRQRNIERLWSRAHLRERGLHQEPVMVFDTWFLSALNFPRCSTARTIALSSDTSEWYESLLRLWRDRRHPHFPVEIHQVLPAPPRHQGDRLGGHLLLLQHHSPEEAGVLFSNYHGQESTRPIDRFAQLVPSALTLERIFWYNDWERVCDQPAVLCQGFYGNRVIRPDTIWPAAHGQHLELHWSQTTSSDTDSADSTMLLQTSAVRASRVVSPKPHAALDVPVGGCDESRSFQFNRAAPAFDPNLPPLASQSEFVQDLHSSWSSLAFSWEDESISAQIVTHFADHLQPLWRCDQGRPVTLFADYSQWEMLISSVWTDHITPGCPLEFFIVTPPPHGLEPGIAAYVIVVQSEQPQLVTSLATLVDEAGRVQGRSAVTTHEHIDGPRLIEALGLSVQCYGPNAPFQCWIWFGDQQLQLQQRIPGRCGYSFTIQMQPRLFWQDPALSFLSSSWPEHDSDRERLTDGRMACNRRPLSLSLEVLCSQTSEAVEQIHEDPVLVPVHVILLEADDRVPSTIFLADGAVPVDVERELQQLGFPFHAYQLSTPAHFLCLPIQWSCPDHHEYYVYGTNEPAPDAKPFVHKTAGTLTELDHMRVLHRHGFQRAVLLEQHRWRSGLTLISFVNNKPQLAAIQQKPRQANEWPAPLPVARQAPLLDVDQVLQKSPHEGAHLPVDFDLLRDFFASASNILCADWAHLPDLPEVTADALRSLPQSTDLTQFDRLVIYTDGTSKTQFRRKAPLWVEEFGSPDAWAFLVLGECYEAAGRPHSLHLVGWHAQTVVYLPDTTHHVGTSYIGSEFSEKEALLWAALWRLAQNSTVATVFRPDSLTTGEQAMGFVGSSDFAGPFAPLRATFQALHAGLGSSLQLSHVRSHQAEPWNDFVDYLAKLQAEKPQWLAQQDVDFRKFGALLPYMWMLFDNDAGLPHFDAKGFYIPPPALPSEHPPACHLGDDLSALPSSMGEFSLSLLTLNVGSLYRGPQGHAGKVAFLRAQMKAHHLNIMGLQETRSDSGASFSDGVYRLASGSANGQLGTELWVNLDQPFLSKRKKPIYLARGHFQVTHADTRRLLVRVSHPAWHALLFVGHAPHTGHDELTRHNWWTSTISLLQQHAGALPIFGFLDANARTGPTTPPYILENDDMDSPNTPFFVDFLQQLNLHIPATGPCHQGSSATWCTPDGLHEQRIDYVLIPVSLMCSCTDSQVVESFEAGNLRDDHCGAGIQLVWQDQLTLNSSSSASRPIQRAQIKHQHRALNLNNLQIPDWSTDIQSQTDALNDQILHQLRGHCGSSRQSPKKPYIDEETWTLRSEKLQARKELKQCRQHARLHLLRKVFGALCSTISFSPDVLHADWLFGTSWLCAEVRLHARFFCSSWRLRRALKTLRSRHLGQVLSTLSASSPASEILQTLKPYIGPTNLKKQKSSTFPLVHKEDGSPCLTRDEAQDRWIEFFGQMEGGRRVSLTEQWSLWRQNLIRLRDTSDFDLTLQDIPSLLELERAFRRVAPGKATGMDSLPPEICRYCPTELARATYTLLMKACTHGQEALTHKGGRLVNAYKHKGALHQARAFLRVQKEAKRPSCLLCLDLTEAFYRVVRPFVVGGNISDQCISGMIHRFGLGPDAIEELQQLLSEPHALTLAGASPQLVNLLQALHSDTWFVFAAQPDVVRTELGSRPGDGFADVIFGFLWSKILRSLERGLVEKDMLLFFPADEELKIFPKAQGPYDHHRPLPAPQPFLGPTWMDDLCLGLAADDNAQLLHRSGYALGLLIDLCQAHQMTPNLKKGKTEVMFVFRGAGSRDLRRRYFSEAQGGRFPVVCEKGVHEVNVVSRYLHLGGLIHHKDVTKPEIARRLSIAHAAFTQHRKLVYCNSALAWDKRVELFQTLILSKLSYGLESWTFSCQRSRDQFHAGVLRLYRRLLGVPPVAHLADDEILSRTRLPSPAELLRRARLRYLGTLYRAQHSTCWGLLNVDQPWLALLRLDLEWMWAQLEFSSDLGNPAEHFGAWEAIIKYHPGYWKRLINRAVLHASLQRHNDFQVRQLHQAIHSLLVPGDTQVDEPCARDTEPQAFYGCLQCRLCFLSKAGEGAHMCRTHGHLAQARGLFDGTACPCCLKEFHSHSRVLAHLRVAHQRRRQLIGRNHRCHPAPGQGSLRDRQLLDIADGAVPFLQASGPLLPQAAAVDFLDYDLHWYEAIYEFLVDLPTFAEVSAAIQELIMERPISWTRWTSTIEALLQDLDIDAVEGLPGDLAQVRAYLRSLLCTDLWQFKGARSPPKLCATASLYAWEMWAYEFADADGALPDCAEVPRIRFKQRVILHAFSGRRRPGDVEWYLDALTRQHPDCIILTVSLDIIINEIHGDVARSATRALWLQAIRDGHVIGFMGGPPCNTWSRARQVAIQGRPGPRVLRLADTAWGRPSLRISELHQIILGNLLLGFALECLTLLAIYGGLGFIEHPRAPEEDHMVSIWKLPIVHAILKLPRVRLLHFAQGLLGAPSAKPTTLMVVGLESLESELHGGRMCASNPHGASVGRDDDGNFRTAPLKEYPPGMCRAVSLAFFQALRGNGTAQEPELPVEFCALVQTMQDSTFGNFIGTVIRGCGSGKSLDVVMPCEVAPKEANGVPVEPTIPWLLREMLGFFDLNVACLEDLHRTITSPTRAQQKLIAKYVHPGSVMILTSSKYSMGLDVAAQTPLRHLKLIHLGDLSSTWAHAYRRWGFVFRTFWTDDVHHSYDKLVKEERLTYLPLGPTPQLMWHGVSRLQNASQRPVKIYFGGSSQRRQSRLQQAQKLLGKDLVVESTASGSKIRSGYDQHYLRQLFRSAMCLQVPGPSIESYRLYESLEAGCIPVVVRTWSQGGDPLVKLQVGGEASPFLYVQAPEDLPQVLQLTGMQLDMLQAQCQAWWTRVRQTFRARAVHALQPPRPSPSMRWNFDFWKPLEVADPACLVKMIRHQLQGQQWATVSSMTGSSGQSSLSHLPWAMIPAFRPGETEINEYSRKLEFLAGLWPTEHLALLAPRAAMLCEGSAFKKIMRLDVAKLKVNSVDGVKLLVTSLGGIWGKSKFEEKFERFERALYSTSQRADETHESYLARHDYQFEELLQLGVGFAEMRAYVLLRNSGLHAEDKRN
eukprot:s274_g8.t1